MTSVTEKQFMAYMRSIDKSLGRIAVALENKKLYDEATLNKVLENISELNAISFYEAQEDSRECYYEIKSEIEKLLSECRKKKVKDEMNIPLDIRRRK